MTTLVWFRNDLRTRDNPALFEACEAAGTGPVHAIYLICDRQARNHGEGDPKLSFLRSTLEVLTTDLDRRGIPLHIRHAPRFADVAEALGGLCRELDAKALYFNAEYPLNEARRDQAVADFCAASGIVCHRLHGDLVLPPGTVVKDDGGPYSVFTPFKRRWLDRASPAVLAPLPAPTPRTAPAGTVNREALAVLPEAPEDPDWPAGEAAAQARLAQFVADAIAAYDDDRDIPAKPATSRLSAHLALGAISVRDCYTQALADKGPGGETWRSELIWREFYRHVIAHYPHVSRGEAFKRETDRLPWRHDPEALDAWKAGATGYPLVDAGMRQLAQTGFMHNRLRMVTAMFLTKHLLIDWREGERHFMASLRDADFASNNGGWQWSASTGTDAAPYFRIFNPESQAKKFDAGNTFINLFIPELRDGTRAYPEPIVEHRTARERALAFFKAN